MRETGITNSPHHFFGVVEDRADPEELGRVRVRAFGFHTRDKTSLPTENLPWATVVNNGASVSGVSRGPSDLVEGSWVFGFWVDGEEFQIPVVLGSFHGFPSDGPDLTHGFSDPAGNYPKQEFLEESDLPRLARSTAEEDQGLKNKRQAKVDLGEVPTAVGSSVASVLPDKQNSIYQRGSWEEPNPRYGGEGNSPADGANQSAYPFNHVRTSESGHAEEWDDTPGSERLHRFHKAGTFEEIQADGSKITKVVGDDFEIVIQDKNMLVAGDLNITVVGDARFLVQGSKIEEVEGDYFLTVHGDHITKIQGNEAKEVLSNKSTNISNDRTERVGNDSSWSIAGNLTTNVSGNVDYTSVGTFTVTSTGAITVTSSGTTTVVGSTVELNP